jgi:hypothetical protein
MTPPTIRWVQTEANSLIPLCNAGLSILTSRHYRRGYTSSMYINGCASEANIHKLVIKFVKLHS